MSSPPVEAGGPAEPRFLVNIGRHFQAKSRIRGRGLEERTRLPGDELAKIFPGAAKKRRLRINGRQINSEPEGSESATPI